MVTAEERLKILQMLQDGKISAEAAAQLLQAMGEDEPQPAARPAPAERRSSPENRWPATPAPQAPISPDAPEAGIDLGEPGRKPRFLRVRVTDTDTGRPR